MRKRLLGMLCGIALLLTLCMNVLAAYADGSAQEQADHSAADPIVDSTATEGSKTSNTESEQDGTTEPLTSQEGLLPTVAQGFVTAAAASPSRLSVDGKFLPHSSTLSIQDLTYISLRSLVGALAPEASIAWEDGQFVAYGDDFSLSARPNDFYLIVNGRYLYVPDGILLHEGNTLAPLRSICSALGASTTWDATTKNITVTTTGSPLQHGNSYYNYDDLYWLSRIITAESRNQPLKGKIAVGTVIQNRVESPKFPNSIKSVIFSGTQFSPVQNGSIYNNPTEEATIAAKLVLDGAREAGDSLFFNRADLNSWASRSKIYIATIGDHSFFL